ncbi:MAG: hypothetical protein HDT14_02565 [Oscillibacter sp.]|nr:hypothetical protein [Oscillibacter sp.]
MGTDYVDVKSFGDAYPKKETNTRTPYEHQKRAIECLVHINTESAYSTLVVQAYRQWENLLHPHVRNGGECQIENAGIDEMAIFREV